MKAIHSIHLIVVFSMLWSSLLSQAKLGVNTTEPLRNLEVVGEGIQNISVKTTTGFSGGSGIELLTGDNIQIDTDWRILNETGGLKFLAGDYNTFSFESEKMRFNSDGEWGIGTGVPQSQVHVEGGSTATPGGGGYLTLGYTNGLNTAFDNTRIIARSNGSVSPFYIQPYGGNTFVGLTGGNVYIANANQATKAGIGTDNPTHRVSIHDNLYQVYLRNDADDVNDWYIGASAPGWGVGSERLVFAPTNASTSSSFRLHSTTENNGVIAPVMINSGSQLMLLDGNEIDVLTQGLYINHNSQQNTYFNVNEGRVGIGTAFPQTKLHIKENDGFLISLKRGGFRWDLNPTNHFGWWVNGTSWANIDGVTGTWSSISDKNMKANIQDYGSVLNKIDKINFYRYKFNNDPENRPFIGILAQELGQEFPELVFESHDQLGVSYGPLASIAISAIKEQQEIIDELQRKIDLLKSKTADKIKYSD